MTQNPHIIIVDDEAPAREMVGDYLKMHGFGVTLCDGGKSLRAVCAAPDMPTEGAVRSWAVENHEGFGDRMERARVVGCHVMADEILEIADAAHDSDSAAAARVKTENRRWLLSKLLPKTYGDRLDVNHSGTVTVAALLTEARQRRALLDGPTVIEHRPAPVIPATPEPGAAADWVGT